MTSKRSPEGQTFLYPLKFEPIYQYRLWGGRHFADLLSEPLPGNGPIGEAWILSDREDHQSLVANGPLKGQTINQLMEKEQEQLLGKLAGHFQRFPLLLKFLDVQKMLSVQVHPSDLNTDYLPVGEHGKTEAWVVLNSGPESRIYAGLKPGTTADNLQQSVASGTVEDHLSYFTPKPGDSVFIPAGTVHSLGGGVVVFEVQQNSDVTFRLYDWNHVDPKTGKPRSLNIAQALACIDFAQSDVQPVVPVVESIAPVRSEMLFNCKYFRLWRHQGQTPFTVGEKSMPRVLVCSSGEGLIEFDGIAYIIGKGDLFLLPGVVGMCTFKPRSAVTLLEIALPG
jgi:mannose-6-phosphate isomerase